eukprot:GDKH01010934.1.p1 GENE.GDKH01010934.1~~GDKH01010934.1.p1  ORF type:complete len:96 (+),score=5.12 GDKH01010934.1:284-571(+)
MGGAHAYCTQLAEPSMMDRTEMSRCGDGMAHFISCMSLCPDEYNALLLIDLLVVHCHACSLASFNADYVHYGMASDTRVEPYVGHDRSRCHWCAA